MAEGKGTPAPKPEKKAQPGKPWTLREFGGKTVWNWLELLIVPLSIVLISLVFTAAQDQRQQHIESQRAAIERELAAQRAQDEALQAYLDQMGTLMLDRKLPKAEPGDPVHTLAQSRTSTAILALDAEHNESVTRFLSDSGLVTRSDEFTDGLLRGIALSRATLSGAYLPDADLVHADLSGADLSNGLLVEANLLVANLSGADLSGADLVNADLSGADLSGADLHGVNLSGAEGVMKEQLEQAASLKDATMPNGKKYEDWIKSKSSGEDEGNNGSS